MLSVHLSAVPEYLREGAFFLSMDQSSDDDIQIPLDALKPDLSVENPAELEHLLASLSYWGVADVPYQVLGSIYRRKVVWRNGRFDETFPDLLQVHTIASTVPDGEHLVRAAQLGSLLMVRYLVEVEQEKESLSRACAAAARSGHVHILDYIHEHGGLLTEHVMASAFSGGNLECLEYLRKAGLFKEIVNRTLVVENAVASNEMLQSKPKFRTVGGWGEERFLYVSTLFVLQYALALGCIVSPFLLQSAASTGNLEILRFVRSSSSLWDEELAGMMWNAVISGQLRVIEYLHEQGCALTIEVTEGAARGGFVDCLRYVCEHGGPYNEYIMSCATDTLDCLKYLHGIGCPWDATTTHNAAGCENQEYLGLPSSVSLESLKYAVENGCPVSEETMAWACKTVLEQIGDFSRPELDCAQYLLSWEENRHAEGPCPYVYPSSSTQRTSISLSFSKFYHSCGASLSSFSIALFVLCFAVSFYFL